MQSLRLFIFLGLVGGVAGGIFRNCNKIGNCLECIKSKCISGINFDGQFVCFSAGEEAELDIMRRVACPEGPKPPQINDLKVAAKKDTNTKLVVITPRPPFISSYNGNKDITRVRLDGSPPIPKFVQNLPALTPMPSSTTPLPQNVPATAMVLQPTQLFSPFTPLPSSTTVIPLPRIVPTITTVSSTPRANVQTKKDDNSNRKPIEMPSQFIPMQPSVHPKIYTNKNGKAEGNAMSIQNEAKFMRPIPSPPAHPPPTPATTITPFDPCKETREDRVIRAICRFNYVQEQRKEKVFMHFGNNDMDCDKRKKLHDACKARKSEL